MALDWWLFPLVMTCPAMDVYKIYEYSGRTRWIWDLERNKYILKDSHRQADTTCFYHSELAVHAWPVFSCQKLWRDIDFCNWEYNLGFQAFPCATLTLGKSKIMAWRATTVSSMDWRRASLLLHFQGGTWVPACSLDHRSHRNRGHAFGVSIRGMREFCSYHLYHKTFHTYLLTRFHWKF